MLHLLPPLLLGTDIQTIATSADFPEAVNGFAFPHIFGTDVLFSSYGAVQESIVQKRGSTLTTVVTTGQKFSSVTSPSATDKAVTFVGDNTALYLTKHPFIFQDTIAKVGSDGFHEVQNPSLERDNVAFGGIRGDTRRDAVAGIYVSPGDTREVHTLVNASRAQPGSKGKLTCLQNPAISKAGFVAFFGSDCPSASRRQDDDGTRMYRTRPRREHALHLYDKTSEGFTVTAGIYLAQLPASGGAYPPAGEASLTVVADSFSTVPGKPGVSFEAFTSPVASEKMVAFVGATSDGALGVYTYDLSTPGSLRRIADTGTAVPGGSGGTFSDFPYPPSVAGTTVVFYAAAGGTASGLYAHTRSDAGVSTLKKLVTMGDTLNGESIAFLGAGAASSDATTAAFYAVTQTNGVYTVKI